MSESMTITQAADILEKRMNRYHPNDDITKATQIAIGALHYLQPANEPLDCPFCSGNALESLVLLHDALGGPRVAFHGGNTPIPDDEKPLFCPNCGRKLVNPNE